MKSSFINNSLFRIVTPTIYGVIVYVLILLIFDSIKQLSQNFFSFEVMFCIVITYIIFELMRVITNTLENKPLRIQKINYRIAFQVLINISAVFVVTSLILVLYYRYLVGYTDFNSELIVFNTIYIFTSILYNILYFSIVYLNRTNEAKLNHEFLLKQSLENELSEYKSRINPDLLYSSLETVIALMRKDQVKASDFIQKLSDVYRYIVSSKRNEPIELHKEIEITEKLIDILNAKYQNSIKLDATSININSDKKIIPGTLHIVIEELIHNYLVSELQPLSLKGSIMDEYLVIECHTIKRLARIKTDYNEFENLKRAYLNFTEKTITMKDDISYTTISIPLLE
jgi:hypothetical protein